MPTAAKLVAGVVFAALGYAIFVSMVTVYADDRMPEYLLPLCLVAGLIVGWQICGKKALGLMSGVGNGYTRLSPKSLSSCLFYRILRCCKGLCAADMTGQLTR